MPVKNTPPCPKGWAGIHGYTKEEFLATFSDVEKDSELIHPADRDRYRIWNYRV